MTLLKTFAVLSLVSAAILSLLPEGSMRRTAAMVIGLLMLLCWADGLKSVLSLPDVPDSPSTVLAPTALGFDEAQSRASVIITRQWGDEP